MASLRDIRSRIDSVKNTQKITKALKMVAAAKLRRAQDNITNLRPYGLKLLGVIADIVVTHRVQHPLLSQNDNAKKVLFVVVTSDRGLCGGFNSSIVRFAGQWLKDQASDTVKKIDVFFVGRKGADLMKNQGIQGVDTLLNVDKEISFDLGKKISKDLMKSFVDGQYDEVRFVYNAFKSAISQDLTVETILPVDVTQSNFKEENSEVKFSEDLIFEPQPEEMIENLLEQHFAVQVYRILSESVAAEHAARMTAMENASKNAKEMIDKLTLTYNKLRQASITTELTEITSGAEALKG